MLPWEYDRAGLFLLTEFISRPSRLELQMTSSEVNPDEKSNKTVSIVAGHAANNEDNIISDWNGIYSLV